MDEKNQDSIGYAFKAKIMISSVVILFVACFIIVLFHVYKRWFCLRRRRHRRGDGVASVVIVAASRGLDIDAVNSLPTFVYESKNHEYPPECAVCLSEFEDNESGRVLPECQHCFHTDCIGMWLLSHCDCPLCRTRVRVQPDENPKQWMEHVAIDVVSGSGSDSNPDWSSSNLRSPEATIPREQDPEKNRRGSGSE